MTLNRFDPAGSDGTPLATIAGKVDAAVNATTGTVKYKAAAGANRGSGPGIEVIVGATATDTAYFGVPAIATTDLAANVQAWIQFPDSASFGTGNVLIEFYKIRTGTQASGTNTVRFFVASSDNTTYTPGTVIVQNNVGAIITGTTPIALSAATWYRIELGAKAATSTTGNVAAKIYDDNDNLLWDLNHTASDVAAGTIAMTRVVMGKTGGTGSNFKIWITQVGIDTGANIPTIPTVVKNNTLSPPVAALSVTSGPVPRTDGSGGTTLTITLSAANGNGNPKTWAIVIDFSANGLYTDTVNRVDTRGTYVSNNVFTYTPTTAGKYRVTPYVQQS